MTGDILADLETALDWWRSTSDGAPTSALVGAGAVERLERTFEGLTGHACAAAAGSGTSALSAALVAAGVQPGEPVVMAAYDWAAATAATLLIGARPVYVDVDDVGTIDVAEVSDALARTSANVVVATHLLGQLADVPRIVEAAHPLGAVVIEDCAQALGASLRGVQAGGMADLACFSLGPGKLVDAGEGGVVAATRADLAENLQRAVHHPLRQHIIGLSEPTPWAALGRIHPAAAVLACFKLERWRDRLAERRRSAQTILENLHRAQLVSPPVTRSDSCPSWHYLAVVVPDAVDVWEAVAELDGLGLDSGPGPLAHPAGLFAGDLPPRARERHQRSLGIALGVSE